MNDVMQALRADQWLQNQLDVPEELRHTIKQQLRDAFYIDTDEWKSRVVDQARQATRQAFS
jgi:hypothetical protein